MNNKNKNNMNKNALKRLSPFRSPISVFSSNSVFRFPLSVFSSIAVFSFSILLFTSCSNDEVFEQDDTKDTPITIASAGVTELTTRAGIPEGSLTDGALSFWFNVSGEYDSKYVATNEKWEYEQGWKFKGTDYDNNQLFWKGDGNTGTFYALYPYSDSYGDNIDAPFPHDVQKNQDVEANLLTSDLLWAKGVTNNNTIDIVFTHMMSKFAINLTRGTEVDENTHITTMSILDVPLEHTVLLENWSITSTKAGTIKPLSISPANGYMASYEAIVSPTTYSPTLVITMNDGRTFSATLNKQEFKSGTQYNISLQVGQDKVTLGDITAESWKAEDGGELETE